MAQEEVGQIHLDFDIYSNTPQSLIIADLSEWVYAENLASYVTITLPGSSKKLDYVFNKHSLNPFNSHNLGLSCLKNDCGNETYINLPDGIYTVTVKSGYEGIETTKFYLKTDAFELAHAKVIVKHGLEYDKNDKKFQDAMFDVSWLLVVAKAQAKDGDFVKANRFLNEAKLLLKHYMDCKECL